MSVVVACEDLGPCSKKLTIEVPAEAVQAEIGRVIGEYRRELRLPGFRRGKVPARLVRQRFGEDIEREVTQRLVPRYWRQAQAEQNLDPLLPPRFEETHIEEGEPLTLVAAVETRPEIELGNIREFSLPQDRIEPLDEEIDSELNEIRRRLAIWKPVDRTAARGDVVVARAHELDDSGGEATGGGESRPFHVELGADGVDEELNLALSGRSAGQSADYHGMLVSAESRKYRIEVTEVRELELPELDDELAVKVGDFESVETLREAVREELRRRREADLRQRRRQAILDQLRERHPLTLPQGVVQREVEAMVQREAHILARQGIDVERADIDWARRMDLARPQAEKEVHGRLLLDAVARAEGIRLDESEFERFLASMAAQQKRSTVELRQQLSQSDQLEAVRADLLRQQTLRHLLGEDAGGEAPGDSPEGSAGASEHGEASP